MQVAELISILAEWPVETRVIITLSQGDKIPRRFEIEDITFEPNESTGEIVIAEDGEF